MFRTTFIAVCGSVGKSTAKEILANILAEHASVVSTSGTANNLKFGGVPGTILQVRPWHCYAVVEAGIEVKGDMAKMAAMIKPNIVIMLGVKECHLIEFKTKEGVAEEKAEMLRALGPGDTAVLNGDDPLVRAMVPAGRFRRIEFGCHDQEVKAEAITSGWPERLSFDLVVEDGRYPLRSQLVGKHWVNALLAAVAAARLCGVDTAAAVKTAAAIEPFWARMQPITLDNGVTFLRDEFNGSYDTVVEALSEFSAASAQRKIAVISEYSDSHNSNKPRQKIKRIARAFAAHADVLIVVGDRSDYGRDVAIEEGMPEANVYAAFDVRDASDFLKSVQQPGDLVLLKGLASRHLTRVYLDQLAEVTCTLERCPRQHLCDRCGDLGFQYEPRFNGLMAPPTVVV